jgi:hypothetical protein
MRIDLQTKSINDVSPNSQFPIEVYQIDENSVEKIEHKIRIDFKGLGYNDDSPSI